MYTVDNNCRKDENVQFYYKTKLQNDYYIFLLVVIYLPPICSNKCKWIYIIFYRVDIQTCSNSELHSDTFRHEAEKERDSQFIMRKTLTTLLGRDR